MFYCRIPHFSTNRKNNLPSYSVPNGTSLESHMHLEKNPKSHSPLAKILYYLQSLRSWAYSLARNVLAGAYIYSDFPLFFLQKWIYRTHHPKNHYTFYWEDSWCLLNYVQGTNLYRIPHASLPPHLPHDKPRRAPVLTLFYFQPHVDAVF